MGPGHAADVLIVSLGSTEGLRRADAELQDSLCRAGASAETVSAVAPAELPTMMLTDLAWARAARAAAKRALAPRGTRPAVIYSSTTAALLWPCPGAVRFDAPSAGNRPGRHGLWQRPLERRRLGAAPLLLPWSEGALREAPAAVRGAERALVLPVPVEPSHGDAGAGTGTGNGSDAPAGGKDVAALTYAANPRKKGLDRVLAAWRRVRAEGHAQDGDELLIAGTTPHELQRAGLHPEPEAGVRVLGPISSAEYRALVRRARVFVCAPRREDYGIAQLEALADGCLLVTTPAPGPYAALPIARSLDARLVSEDLAGALRAALSDPRADYAERARAALLPFSRSAVDRVVAEQLLPRLLA
jgi:hypothetical protein